MAKGMRNAALFAYLCRLRHGGKPEEFIRSEAWRVVARIPEPMGKFEVEKTITNAMKFDARAVGNNTLVEAWRTVEQIEAGPGATKFYLFLLLVERLAEMRPETRPTILLPVRSIGTLMNAHFTQVAKWRRRAVEMGILSITSRYVRRSLADEFAVKTGFSPLADGPAPYKVKRGRKPKKPVELDQAAQMASRFNHANHNQKNIRDMVSTILHSRLVPCPGLNVVGIVIAFGPLVKRVVALGVRFTHRLYMDTNLTASSTESAATPKPVTLFGQGLPSTSTLEPVTKLVALIAIWSYICGFLIIVINEGRLGFVDASLLKARAITAGGAFLVLVTLPIAYTQGTFIPKNENEPETNLQSIARLLLGLTDFFTACWAIWIMMSYFFVGSSPIAFLSFGNSVTHIIGFGYAAWLLCIVTIPASSLIRFSVHREFRRSPRAWIAYSVCCLSMLFLSAVGMRSWPSLIYLAWGGITSTIVHSHLRDMRRGDGRLKKMAYVALSLTLISLYAALIFPSVKGTWGGGAPVPATIAVSKSSLTHPGERLQVEMLEATDSGYYFQQSGQKTVSYLLKASIDEIEFTSSHGL